ncbi:MAG: hypothetical protein HYS45_00840 [Parcubacteria group bacterium]|nr:hypothetical protein [Parcubacteria group bacterium]
MMKRTNINLAWKTILSGLFSASFLALGLLPAAVSAVAENGACDISVATQACDSGLLCDTSQGTAAATVTDGKCVDPNPQKSSYGLTDFTDVGLGQTQDLKGSIANIINIILGFLGIVAVIIILAGGFKWMTAGGNEDKVGESRQMIIQGIIGLVVVFAAWAIASFVVSNLQSATA